MQLNPSSIYTYQLTSGVFCFINLFNGISLGIQEFVEAISFLHYIRHRNLISLEEINAKLVFMREEKTDPKVHFIMTSCFNCYCHTTS